MAQSQAPYLYNDEGDQIELCLSSSRFKPYITHAGFNRQYAFNLYLYNARLSKSFLYPLHILEITLRNRMSAIFTNLFGKDWPVDLSFQNNLTPESLASLTTAIGRAKTQTTDSIVSTLNFDFWSNLFRSEYYNCFWQANLAILTPSWNLKIATLRSRSRDLNFFRNRIAHHEPIYQENLIKIHKEILEMISWFCKDTSDWVGHFSTVNEVMRTSPDPLNELKPHYIDRADKNFINVIDKETLDFSSKFDFFVCSDDATKKVICVIDKKNIANFLLGLIDSSGHLMEDLNEYTYIDLIKKQKIINNFSIANENESFHKSYEVFKGFKISHILVVDKGGLPIGIVSKSHRRY